MKKISILFVALLLGVGTTKAQPIYKDAQATTQERVDDLLRRMTVQEKIGQLCCPLGWEMYTKTEESVSVSDKFKQLMTERSIGAFWAVLRADPWTKKTLETGLNPAKSAEALNKLQHYAMEQTRLGIPLFFAEECPHGHMAIGTTVFPTSIAQASTWNIKLIEKMAQAIGTEARAQGANIGYGPVLDIARDPRWSRMEETYGEDPVLAGAVGAAFVRGIQQNIYATLKHFTAYGIPEGGHNGSRANVGMHQLFSDYLPSFKEAVEAGATTIMTSYNAIDGIPCTANNFLLKEVLRKEWGFKGALFSDLGSIEGISTAHHVAPTIKEAATMALKAGVNWDLGGQAYGNNLEKALDEKLISMEELDEAVGTVLRLKFKAGLFENPYVDPQRADLVVHSTANQELAYQVAQQGVVLLKNEGLLPLQKTIKSIAVVGPNADNYYNQLGDYTAPQERSKISTLLNGIQQTVSAQTKVTYVKGCAIRDTTQSTIADAVKAARNAEVTIVVVGGSSARDFKTSYLNTGAATVTVAKNTIIPDMDAGEGYDRSTLHLLGDQEKLIRAIAATGKPMVVVYIQGRPLNMNLASTKAAALLTAWYPGEQGGKAIASVLFGAYNPAGRLPVSVPRSVGQLPVYYSLGKQHDYVEESATPLYSFGYGLSYSSFTYSNLTIEPLDDNQVKVSFLVKNNGPMDGEEVPQLYLRDHFASVATPTILLKKFSRIFLKNGEKKQVNYLLTPKDLSIYNQQMLFVVEPGSFTVMIGASATDIRLKDNFTVKE